jgi:hypothetical protein
LRFLWAKGLNAKDIHKEMFPVYGGKCLLRKVVHKCFEKSLKDVRKSQVMPYQVRKLLRQQPKDFYAAGFETLLKQWDKCINVGGGYVEKLLFFPWFEYNMFYVLYPFVTYLLTLPRISLYLSTCLISLSFYLSIHLSIPPPMHLFLHIFIYLSTYLILIL